MSRDKTQLHPTFKSSILLVIRIKRLNNIDFRIINGYELPRPWQIGGLQAGPQQPLGALNPFDGAA